MFTTPCFIRKNTPELRRFLEWLGYEYIGKSGKSASHIDYSFIVAESGRFYETLWIAEEHKPKLIDCGLNEELFKAISTLNDGTDKFQWFICDEEDDVANKGSFVLCRYDKLHSSNYHKATVEELIEHFKQE